MFYKQFSRIIDSLNEDFVNEFDFWLATLPQRKQSGITAYLVTSKFKVALSVAEIILEFAKQNEILKEEFLVRCPNDECDMPLKHICIDEISSILESDTYCTSCEGEYIVGLENIFKMYTRIKKPDASDDEIRRAIMKRMGNEEEIENFQNADSLANDPFTVFKAFYNPDESAYSELKILYKDLDAKHKNKKAQGDAFEKLALRIIEGIKMVKGTNSLRTGTNQFDCIVKQPLSGSFPTVLQIMTPYFIVECKNEKTSPSNTYFHKISSIVDTNEAQLGIVFSRKPAGGPARKVAHQKYLLNSKTTKKQFLISLSDTDLNLIINERENFLKYLSFKHMELTTNATNANYQWFTDSKGKKL